jgi:hypothetical protein
MIVKDYIGSIDAVQSRLTDVSSSAQNWPPADFGQRQPSEY